MFGLFSLSFQEISEKRIFYIVHVISRSAFAEIQITETLEPAYNRFIRMAVLRKTVLRANIIILVILPENSFKLP